MTAAQWFVVGMFVVVVLFIAWVWAMNRLDERDERQEAERLRAGPPVLGGGWQREPWPDPGAPRHRRRR